MSSSGRQPQTGAEHRERGLHVDADVTGVYRDRERLGGRQAGAELAVDEQRPDVAESHVADEILDVHAAVAERAAVLVRLGDLGLERDDAFESRLKIGHFFSFLPPGGEAPLALVRRIRWRPLAVGWFGFIQTPPPGPDRPPPCKNFHL